MSDNFRLNDDISKLAEAFSFSAFRYVDIAREERLASILARWPLLNELSAQQKENACRS
ncbi:cellulose biosynthesis protein BcsR [Pantoea alhagi]|uniref:cellulose biosynthesis protein BcsR n=1 Tax=Pantoea alhagi TaxID=1891675 RepID=UPI00202B74B2|nr:cellulose biosynthesis protein BcsR [Pantoea alhagi]URQ62664.1 cellulose biosynthesis protein BcsR [Pantoea alhagi]